MYVVIHYQNLSIKTVLMRGHNICFYLEIRKIYLNYPQYLLLSGTLMADVPFSVSGTAFVVMATVLSLLTV